MKKTAMLIDGDNVGISVLENLFLTKPFVLSADEKFVFGNHESILASVWERFTQKHGIQTQASVFMGNVCVKNAADFQLTIKMVELICSGEFETFHLVTSDSDFLPVIHYARSRGVVVNVFGKVNHSHLFEQARIGYDAVDAMKAGVSTEELVSHVERLVRNKTRGGEPYFITNILNDLRPYIPGITRKDFPGGVLVFLKRHSLFQLHEVQYPLSVSYTVVCKEKVS